MKEHHIQRVLVLLNATAGTLAKADDTGAEGDRIKRLFAAQGIDADVRSQPVKELCEAASGACAADDFDAIIAGGGDGTLNAVASVVAEHDKVFGVIPLGTHNHFAKDLGVPLDLEEALAALARATVQELPVGEVNGKLFLNFSSIGIHPEIVRHRDAQQKVLGRRKFFAMFLASLKVFARFPLMRVRIAADDRPPFVRVTPSVILGNNVHQLQVFGLTGGHYDNRETLSIFVARSHGRLSMFWLSLRALVGSLERAEDFESLAAKAVTIDSLKEHTRVSLDGEVVDMEPPLKYRMREKGLKVLMPQKPKAGSL